MLLENVVAQTAIGDGYRASTDKKWENAVGHLSYQQGELREVENLERSVKLKIRRMPKKDKQQNLVTKTKKA